MNAARTIDDVALRVVRWLCISLTGRDIPPDDAVDLLQFGITGFTAVLALASIALGTAMHLLDPRLGPLLIPAGDWRRSPWSVWWDSSGVVCIVSTVLASLVVLLSRGRPTRISLVVKLAVLVVSVVAAMPNVIPALIGVAAFVGVLAIRKAVVEVVAERAEPDA